MSLLLALGFLACVDFSSPDTGTADGSDGASETGQPTDDTGDTGETKLPSSGDLFTGLTTAEHAQVATILELSWTQSTELDEVWVEFRVGGASPEAWRRSPVGPRAAGAQHEVLLGLPGQVAVDLRIHTIVDGVELATPRHSAETGMVPLDFPRPEMVLFEPSLASEGAFLYGSVDTGNWWYSGPWWLYIMDREGRIVWYREIAEGNCTMFPRVSRDGTHLMYERSSSYSHYDSGARSTLWRTNLTGSAQIELAVPGLGYTWSETDEGSIIFDDFGDENISMDEMWPDGTRRTLWECSRAEMGSCYTNTATWQATRNSVLWSMYSTGTVIEVDRETGEILRQFGQRPDSWSFDEPAHNFEMQHFPNFTPEGNLLLSTHVPTGTNQQRAQEYRLHEESQRLELVWSFGEGHNEYAVYAGEAVRLEGGNTLINYGTDGEVREVTPEGEVAWEAKFPSNLLMGHNELIVDLYAVEQGPLQAPE